MFAIFVATLNSNWNDNRLKVNSNDNGNNENNYSFGMALAPRIMENKNLFNQLTSFDNLFLAYQKARKGKTRKNYVIKFEKNLEKNLLDLQFELMAGTYKPLPLKNFILRDPKTRNISKSDFRDRVIHHALVNILEPIFEKAFIPDSCANRLGKGTLYALKRFEKFQRKVTCNFTSAGFCFKADIKHYFQEVDRNILLNLIKRKISNDNILNLIKSINANFELKRERESNIWANAIRRILGKRDASWKSNLAVFREHLSQ